MEVENAMKPELEEKADVPSLDDAQDAVGKLIEESRPEEHTNCTKETADNTTSIVEKDEKGSDQEPEKTKEETSKRVKEAQRYNNRDRGGRGQGRGRNDDRGYRDRPNRKNNIKSDLTSQQESSDPVAIRKQVGTA